MGDAWILAAPPEVEEAGVVIPACLEELARNHAELMQVLPGPNALDLNLTSAKAPGRIELQIP